MKLTNMIVPPGKSGRPAEYNSSDASLETVANELSLLNLGDFEPLNIKVDPNWFMDEIKQYDGKWVDYLPRTDRPNNRQSLVVSNLPGKSYMDNPSLPQASMEAGRKLSETEFNIETEVYYNCVSLQNLLSDFTPLGRSFLVKSNIGGYFMPHRDQPSMPRETFRLIAFLNNCAPYQYDWIMGDDKKLNIEMGRLYYCNTRKTHRTISWVNDSIHLIVNVPFTTSNVAKVISKLQHTH
jgi:hypothetical protein